MWSPTTSSDELYHFGILGQKWGHKNGPPYPIADGNHSAAEKKAMKKAKRAERNAIRKEKKQAKKDRKIQKKADKEEAKRQKILKTGSLKEVRKLKGNISNEEYNEVFKRLDNEAKLDDYDKKQKVNLATKINAAQSVVSNMDKTSKAALSMYNRGAAIYNTVAKVKGWDVQSLPIVNEKQGGNNEKNKKDDDDD